jgi:hypothetical protein
MTIMRCLGNGTCASVLVALSAQCAWGAPAPDGEQWRWSITPYLWLPTINGEFAFDLPQGGDASVGGEIGPSDYLTNLEGALMLNAEFRADRWAFNGDLIWLDLTTDVSRLRSVTSDGETITIPRETNLDTETELSGAVMTVIASRLLSESSSSSVAALGGLRYLGLDADVDWQLTTTITRPGFTLASEGRISGSVDLYDAIVGLRGQWRFGTGDHWYVPWYLDVGAGSSDLTWQAMAGIGYAFTRTSVLGVWRHLDYDPGNDDVLSEISLGGPAIGFTWRF